MPCLSKYGMHQNQISQWKQQAKEQIAAGFAGKFQKAQQNDEARIKELHAKMTCPQKTGPPKKLV